MNSVGLKLKVYVKSLRDLDLDLVAIIAIPPMHHLQIFSKWNNGGVDRSLEDEHSKVGRRSQGLQVG